MSEPVDVDSLVLAYVERIVGSSRQAIADNLREFAARIHRRSGPVQVDRDALVRTFLETFDKGGLWDGLEPEAYKVRHRTQWAGHFADAVLALLSTKETQ